MTTFILPSGKYRYTRAPMGLNALSDEFCRRTDEALAGVDGVVKVVDDILVQAEDYDQLEERLEQVLERCRAARITLTKGKFFVGEQVKFAGFIITGTGIKPDPGKIRAISDFPAPTNISALRSFLGLANQLGMFHPGLAAATDDLRWLLKKDVAWSWTPEIHNAFLRVKELLSSEACVRPFQTNRLAELITDASSIHGLGFALLQDGFLIQAGSRSLIDAETRYAVVELEATAVAWAIKQCRHYLLGCRNFKVWTDHRPLVGIFKKDMASVDSRRLNRIRESLLGYNFEVEYLAGKDNVIADALSRFPVSVVTADDLPDAASMEDDDEVVNDPAIAAFAAATAADKDLQAVIGVLGARCPPSKLPPQHPARPYASVLDELSISSAGILVLRGNRIVVPKTLRPQVVRALHAGHAGITKTLLHARQHYSWPYMANDIKTVIDACEACQEHRQGPHFEPEVKRVASYPMEAVSVDLMEVKGTKYLVMVDRFSSYPLVKVVRSATTASITKILSSWFNEFGWPKSIGSDGGPQFKEQFKEFCTAKKIIHELSSVRNPQSNASPRPESRGSNTSWKSAAPKKSSKPPSSLFATRPWLTVAPPPPWLSTAASCATLTCRQSACRTVACRTVAGRTVAAPADAASSPDRFFGNQFFDWFFRAVYGAYRKEEKAGQVQRFSTRSASSIRTPGGGTTPELWCGPEPATSHSSS
jgi:hypothetical protein